MVSGLPLRPTSAASSSASHQIERILGRQPTGPTGSGDVYGNVLDYAPAGTVFGVIMKFGSSAVAALNKRWPKLGDNIQDLLGIKTILRILTATRDRRIPGDVADVYPYKEVEVVGDVDLTVEGRAAISRESNARGRYPSETYESFGLWRRVFGE